MPTESGASVMFSDSGKFFIHLLELLHMFSIGGVFLSSVSNKLVLHGMMFEVLAGQKWGW